MYRKRRGHTTYTALKRYLQTMLSGATPKPQDARTTSRCGSRRLGIGSSYPYCAHTAEEVSDGPLGDDATVPYSKEWEGG